MWVLLTKFRRVCCPAAVHDLDPDFRSFSRSEKVAAVLQSLNIKRPLPVQSMYIFKVIYLMNRTPDCKQAFTCSRPCACTCMYVCMYVCLAGWLAGWLAVCLAVWPQNYLKVGTGRGRCLSAYILLL